MFRLFNGIYNMPSAEASAVYSLYLGMLRIADYYNIGSAFRRTAHDGMNLLHIRTRRVDDICSAIFNRLFFICRNPMCPYNHICTRIDFID